MYGHDATEWIKKIHADYKRRLGKKNAITQQEIARAIPIDYLYFHRVLRKFERGKKIQMRDATLKLVKQYAEKL